MIVQDFDFYIIFLFQGTKNTIEYFLKIIYKLKPLENDVLAQIYEKLLSYLTHQWVIVDSLCSISNSWSMSTRDSVMDTDSREHWREMKAGQALALYTFFIKFQETIDEKLSKSQSNAKV